MTAPGGLAEQAHRYALDVARLLTAVLPGAPTDVVAEVSGDRVVLRPSGPVLLRVAGEPLAELNITVRCRLASRGRWLAVDASRYELRRCWTGRRSCAGTTCVTPIRFPPPTSTFTRIAVH